MLIATSNSAILLLISVAVTVLVFRCSNRCNASNGVTNCPRVVVLDSESGRIRDSESDLPADMTNPDSSDFLNSYNMSPSYKDGSTSLNKDERENEVKRPQFQHKK